MQKLADFLLKLGIICLLSACNMTLDEEVNTAPVFEFNYTEIDRDILNPDRGFYHQTRGTSPRGHLGRVYYDIGVYKGQEIGNGYLTLIKNNFKKARKQNRTLILRFIYHWPNSRDAPNGIIKRGAKAKEGSIQDIETHISQLAPLLNQYKDQIAFVEMGLLGFWGEWHGGRSGNPQNPSNPIRRKVIKLWLNNTDPSIYFALRYPEDRFANSSLPGIARVGFHNDCANASGDSYRKFRFRPTDQPQGGEICQLPGSYSCGAMLRYLKKYQFDTLNGSFYIKRLSRLRKEGCYDEVKRRLGYRYVLIGSTFAEGILKFAVKNVGFGKSFKNRKLSLKVEGKIINTDIDVKSWKPEKTYYYEVNIGKTNSKFAEIIIENNIKLANITGNVIQLTR